MKAHLLYRDREFDWRWALQAGALREEARGGRRYQIRDFDWNAGLPWNAEALTTDLGLTAVFDAMARGDDWILDVSRRVQKGAVTLDRAAIERDARPDGKFVLRTNTALDPAEVAPACKSAGQLLGLMELFKSCCRK